MKSAAAENKLNLANINSNLFESAASAAKDSDWQIQVQIGRYRSRLYINPMLSKYEC